MHTNLTEILIRIDHLFTLKQNLNSSGYFCEVTSVNLSRPPNNLDRWTIPLNLVKWLTNCYI